MFLVRSGAGLLLAALALYGGAHLLQVHQQSWQWRWTPSATSPLVHFRDRGYLRGEMVVDEP